MNKNLLALCYMVILLVWMGLALPSMLFAQDGASTDPESTVGDENIQSSVVEGDVQPETTLPEIPHEQDTPRQCFLKFKNSMLRFSQGDTASINSALECLDLSNVPTLVRSEIGQDLVAQLAKIIDYTAELDENSIPDSHDGPPYTLISRKAGSIQLVLLDDGTWRVSAESVEKIPDIYRAMELAGEFHALNTRVAPDELLSGGESAVDKNFRSMVPDSWKRRSFLIENWLWGFFVILIVAGYIAYLLIPWLIGGVLLFFLRRVIKDRDESTLVAKTRQPIGLLATSVLWWIVIPMAGVSPGVLIGLLVTVKLLLALAVVWLFFRLIDILTEYIVYKTSLTGRSLDNSLAAFISGSLKTLITLIMMVLVASNMGYNVTGLVAGLGIGGLAIALAAQQSLGNLFGSITIFVDRPFRVGDYIIVDNVEGIVEHVGFRSTRVKTFYNSVISIPNGELTVKNIDNMGLRQYRRIKTTLSVTYDTPPARLEAFCAGIRELIRVHPYTLKENYHVWMKDFAAYSLDIQLIFHLDVQDYAMESRERHRMYMDIMRLAQSLGIEFAFPTETQYNAVQKPPSEPVFPDVGQIIDNTNEQIQVSMKKAREIAASELGGPDVKPAPFDYMSNESDFDTRGSQS